MTIFLYVHTNSILTQRLLLHFFLNLQAFLIFLCFREGGGEELACYCRGEGRRERKAAKGNNVIHSQIMENKLLESKRLVRSAYA